VAINKIDSISEDDLKDLIKKLKKIKLKPLVISGVTQKNTDLLVREIKKNIS
jgi:50S ribosomal subunit-associated GTPase HflX